MLPCRLQSTLEVSSRFGPLLQVLDNAAYFEHIFVNDHLPTDVKERHKSLCILKENGLPLKTVFFTYAAGNNVGNYHYIWKVPEDSSEAEMLKELSRIEAQIHNDLPTFHTRMMRKQFSSLVGRLVRPKKKKSGFSSQRF